MAFVACDPHTVEYGQLASLLLQMTDEMGYHVWTVRTVPGGFEAHDDVIAVLNGQKVFTKDLGEAAALLNEGKTPPSWWDEPMEQPNVELSEDGKYYLTIDEGSPVPPVVGNAASREEIRAWAKENGLEPAAQGKLKQSVIDAYYAAH